MVIKFISNLLKKNRLPALRLGIVLKDASGSTVLGCDIDPASEPHADVFLYGPFQSLADWDAPRPDIALVNAPFDAADKKALYPELFLRG